MAGRHAGAIIVTLNEHFTEAKSKEALRVLILQRFAGWLDDVLAEEKPLEGVAEEVLTELFDEKESDTVGPEAGASDLYSTWSALTALTQEIKLQGRAFKQLSEKIAPFTGMETMIDKLLTTHQEAISDVRRIAEEGRTDRTERETELKRTARQGARRELIGVITELRDSLTIGLRSAVESQRKMEEQSKRRRLKKFFIHRSADHSHMLEIVGSLKKGYQMGLDRIDETLLPLGVTEIVCDGKPFDPRVMKAADIEESGKVPDGTVLEVYRTGYMIDTEVFQPAQVKVARTPRKE
jgi:molecular chaperone GrpE